MLILCTYSAAQSRSFKPKFNLKGLGIELFLQKTQKFLLFFLRLLSGVKNFNTSPMATFPFEKIMLDALNSEQKLLKKPVDRAGQKPVGWSTVDFEIYRLG